MSRLYISSGRRPVHRAVSMNSAACLLQGSWIAVLILAQSSSLMREFLGGGGGNLCA